MENKNNDFMIICVVSGEVERIWGELELRYGTNTSRLNLEFILIHLSVLITHICMWMQN